MHIGIIKAPLKKLNAIMGRDCKKDFIDLNFYFKKHQDGSIFLVIKSLAYFDYADEQEIPFMFQNTSGGPLKIIR
jgi:hypothetical protein